jgi:hypothetical protein
MMRGVFEPGRVYVRGELHRQWDGTTEVQRQGGILTPREEGEGALLFLVGPARHLAPPSV